MRHVERFAIKHTDPERLERLRGDVFADIFGSQGCVSD
jgi:hypothetical protein